MAVEQRTATSYPVSYSTSGSIKGTNYQNAVGKGSDTDAASGNDYASGSGNTAYIEYAFSFDIPESATIDSVECTVKGHCESTSSSSEQADLQLYAGSTAKGSVSSFTSTSAQVLTLTTGTWTRDEIDSMVLRFTIGYYGGLVNGATITVTYSFNAVYYTVTSTLSGNGTIDPSGETSLLDGATYSIVITPTDTSEAVTATLNGTDITSDLVSHYAGGTLTTNLGTYTLESGGFNSGESYFEGIVGNGVDASQTTSNYYSSGSSTQAVFTYSLAFTNIPSNATIERVYCEVNGHAESSSNSNEYMCVQLKSGSTELSEQINFKNVSTSNTTITLEATSIPTVSQLSSMVLECTLGYYGGAINGATCYVVYSIPSEHPEYYTYSFVVNEASTLAVTIGSVASNVLYLKSNGEWSEVNITAAYVKTNGAWVETDITEIFDTNSNYIKKV